MAKLNCLTQKKLDAAKADEKAFSLPDGGRSRIMV